ncbi:Nucleolar protein 9 [Coemansia sp. RSA 2607]|nr:Nucleolar protein 9 [Coemansia sp. RSA 2607]KAJ2392860.1 Nucleolar protein 9 [Coemansia sp. RSA 2603]
MGADKKRKIRRGKRGGDAKKQTDNMPMDVDTDVHMAEPEESTSKSDGGYVAPPMETSDSLFYVDTKGGLERMEEDMEKISPASYGLVNPDLQKYIKSCEEMLDDSRFESAEDREIFVNNVYTEMKNYELQLTTDNSCSLILEKIFGISSDYQIRRFLSLTREDIVRLAVHRFSSHAIQTLLLLSAVALEREVRGETNDFDTSAAAEDGDGEANGHQAVRTQLPTFEELVLEIAKTMTAHWTYLMADEFASHVLRVLLLVMSGRPIEDQTNPKGAVKSKRSAKYAEERNGAPAQRQALTQTREVPASFGRALKKLLSTTSATMSDIVARGFINNTVGSPVLQLMIDLQAEYAQAEYAGSLLDKCLMGLVSEGSVENSRRDAAIRLMFEDVVGSHFLQSVARIASQKLLQTIYDRYVRGNLKALAFHPIANFVVQSVFSNAKSERQLKAMITEAGPMFESLLFKNRPGVVRALIDSCVRLNAGHLEIINALYAGFGAKSSDERKELINLLAFLLKYNDFVNADYDRLQFKIQGALIIQSILQFPGDGNEPIVESFSSQSPERILSWCKDPSGSRIVEAVLKSPQVSAKSKQQVFALFSGRCSELSMDKFGSRIFETFWDIADIGQKEKAIQELVLQETQLKDNFFGRFVLRNCRVDQYKRRAEEWRERERGLERKKLMFNDILGKNAAAPADAKSSNSKKSVGADVSASSKKPLSKDKPAKKKDTSNADEIDSLFKKSQSRTSSNGGVDKQIEQATSTDNTPTIEIDPKGDKSLEAVISAITGTKRKSKSKSKDKDKDADKEKQSSKKSKKSKEEERKKRRAFAA